MSKQEVFDICMIILTIALAAAAGSWYAAHEVDRPCKFVSPYSNTLQHDMHRKLECKDK
jgi:hypothetical protein